MRERFGNEKKIEEDWKGKKQIFWVLQALKTHGMLGGKNQLLCKKNEHIYNIYVYKLHKFWAIQRFEYVKNAQKNELLFNVESQEKYLSWQGFYRPTADVWVDYGPFSLKNYKLRFSPALKLYLTCLIKDQLARNHSIKLTNAEVYVLFECYFLDSPRDIYKWNVLYT